MTFVKEQRELQASFFREQSPDAIGYRGSDYRLQPDRRDLNIDAAIRDKVATFFAAKPSIQWHVHANHALSSQVCCVNFLMPLADKPGLLSRWIGHNLEISPPELLVIEPDRAGRDWFLTFEWIGDKDYLKEAGSTGARVRGANATAADAAVQFRTLDGNIHLVLIEWKYTEVYGAPLTGDPDGKRLKRYSDIAFAPSGPISADQGLSLTDFFWEPFYQLLRQQMLAWQIENDPDSGIDRARVLHISPAGNMGLHRVTSPVLARFGDDAFGVFRSLLADPDAFMGTTIERAFAPLALWPEADWYPALSRRYSSLCAPPEAEPS